jgi:hypothetical protein
MLDKQGYMHAHTYVPGHPHAHTRARTHTDIFIAFPWQQLLHKCASVLCYTYIACLVKPNTLDKNYTLKNAAIYPSAIL